MENIAGINITNDKMKKIFTIPYEGKVKNFYFLYSSLFAILAILVYIFSLFIIINLVVHGNFIISNNIDSLNIVITPILDLFLTSSALILLLLAPQRVHHSTKQSSIMFYFSFWMLVISTLLNSQLQMNYNSRYLKEVFYNWLDVSLLKIIIVISVFSLISLQIIFWIMRRKFTFMPTDYEIYMKRIEEKRANKAIKSEKKLIKKHEKLNEKIKKAHLKDNKIKKGVKNGK